MIDFENQMKTLGNDNSDCDQKMKKGELGDIKYVVGVRQKSKLRKETKKFEEVIEEGGQQEEELTHWIMPAHVFLSYVDENSRDNNIKWLRKRANEG